MSSNIGDTTDVPSPRMEILTLLRTYWNDDMMPFDESRLHYRNKSKLVMHTGWYDRDGELPCVTVSSATEGPLDGGTTGYTATHGGTGKPMQRIDGAVSVNFVAGAREHLRGTASDGSDVNPKAAREAMAKHGCQILLDAGSTDLLTTAPGRAQEVEDTGDEEEHTIFRTSVRAMYQYDRVPNG